MMLTQTETTTDEARDETPDEARDETPDETPDEAGAEKLVSFRLARFVAVLALSREKLEFFLDYPELTMNRANLLEEEKALLSNDNFQALCLYLAKVGPRPTSPDPPPPPPGG